MPTTYTHDLFGREIYRQLPAEMKNIIKKKRQSVQDRTSRAGYPVLSSFQAGRERGGSGHAPGTCGAFLYQGNASCQRAGG